VERTQVADPTRLQLVEGPGEPRDHVLRVAGSGPSREVRDVQLRDLIELHLLAFERAESVQLHVALADDLGPATLRHALVLAQAVVVPVAVGVAVVEHPDLAALEEPARPQCSSTGHRATLRLSSQSRISARSQRITPPSSKGSGRSPFAFHSRTVFSVTLSK
jgi:hypothetical protein